LALLYFSRFDSNYSDAVSGTGNGSRNSMQPCALNLSVSETSVCQGLPFSAPGILIDFAAFVEGVA